MNDCCDKWQNKEILSQNNKILIKCKECGCMVENHADEIILIK